MNRRETIKALTAGATAAIAAPAVAQAAGNPDAALAVMADRYIHLFKAYEAAYRTPGLTIEQEEEIDRRTAPMQAEMNDILDRMTRTPATTPAGVAAMARVATLYLDPLERNPEDERLCLSDRLAARLFHDARRLA